MGGMPLWMLEAVDAPAVGVVGDGWMVYGPRVDRWSDVDLGRAAHWIFVSRFALDRTLAEGHTLPDTSIAHPGVDPDRFPWSPPGDWRWRLAYVGRVADGKGVDTARAAVGLLPEASLVVDGPGGTVQTPSERIHEAYAAADAVVFPVEWPEPWGLVALEAMSVGRPVIATGTGGSGEYLEDGVNCLLFRPGDAEGLAAAVRRLAGDPGLRARLIAGGRATAARYPQAAFEEAVIARARARASAARAPGA
jgi:glycosyltransferase involved in cell wall biosynthesis